MKGNNWKTLEEVVTKYKYSLKILSDKKEDQKAMQETISLYSLEVEKQKNETSLQTFKPSFLSDCRICIHPLLCNSLPHWNGDETFCQRP